MTPRRRWIRGPDEGRIAARRYTAAADAAAAPLLVLAHGAGAGSDHPFMVRVAAELAAAGVGVLVFDFPFITAGRPFPDPPATLAAAWRTVCRHARRGRRGPLVLGGKSMGGRYASMGAAEGDLHADGLVYLGYPLHPAGKPERLRAAHLPRIPIPQLFVSGDRDALAPIERLRPVVDTLPHARLEILPGADHGFAVRRRDPLTADAVIARLTAAVVEFVDGLGPARPAAQADCQPTRA